MLFVIYLLKYLPHLFCLNTAWDLLDSLSQAELHFLLCSQFKDDKFLYDSFLFDLTILLILGEDYNFKFLIIKFYPLSCY